MGSNIEHSKINSRVKRAWWDLFDAPASNDETTTTESPKVVEVEQSPGIDVNREQADHSHDEDEEDDEDTDEDIDSNDIDETGSGYTKIVETETITEKYLSKFCKFSRILLHEFILIEFYLL